MSDHIDVTALSTWVRSIHATHYPKATSVDALEFGRLRHVWEPETLARTRVAIINGSDPLPVPPAGLLPGFNLDAFTGLDGITYGDLYFVRECEKGRESLHFHELVHVVQWNLLGVERFLEIYLAEMVRAGYRGDRLEQMAYHLQDRFTTGQLVHKGEVYVRTMLEGRPLPEIPMPSTRA